MPSSLSLLIILVFLFLVIVIQSAIDSYFTHPILPAQMKRRTFVLFTSNALAMVITALVFSLLLPLQHQLMIVSRAKGIMGIAVLLVILEYFLWIVPFILIRGWAVREWLMSEEIREKQQAWWSYAMIGSIVTLVLVGPLYVALAIILPLMTSAQEVFGN